MQRWVVGAFFTAGGVLFVLSFFLELVTPGAERTELMKVEIFYMLLMTLGASLLAAALWTTRTMFRDRLGRAGAVGLYLSLAAFAGFFLTSVLAVATAILTGQPAEVFLPFGLALLLSIPGPILMGIGLSRVGELGVPRFLSFAVPVGAVLAFIDVNPVHDVGLGVLGLAWAGLGVGFLHRVQQEPKPVTPPTAL